jgi:hypothetical protein
MEPKCEAFPTYSEKGTTISTHCDGHVGSLKDPVWSACAPRVCSKCRKFDVIFGMPISSSNKIWGSFWCKRCSEGKPKEDLVSLNQKCQVCDTGASYEVDSLPSEIDSPRPRCAKHVAFEPFMFKCMWCDHSSAQHGNLKDHVIRNHPDKDPHGPIYVRPTFSGNPRKRSHAEISQTIPLDSVPVLPKEPIEGLAIKVSDVPFGKPPVYMWPNYVDHATGMWIGGDVSVDLGSESARARVWWLRWCAVENTDENNAFRYYGKFKPAMRKECEDMLGEAPDDDDPRFPSKDVLNESYEKVRSQGGTWEGYIMRAFRDKAIVYERKCHKGRWAKSGREGSKDNSKKNTFSRAIYFFNRTKPKYGGDMSNNELLFFWRSTCRYCGGDPCVAEQSYRVDRVDSTKGYNIVPLNVVPCCKTCNMMKGSYTAQTFIDACATIDHHVNQQKDMHGYAETSCTSDVRFTNVIANTGKNETFAHIKKQSSYKNTEFSISEEFHNSIRASSCCYCGRNGPSGIDRVDPLIGYVEANIVPCCTSCNFMKRRMQLDVFLKRTAAVNGHLTLHPFNEHDVSTFWASCDVIGGNECASGKLTDLL